MSTTENFGDLFDGVSLETEINVHVENSSSDDIDIDSVNSEENLEEFATEMDEVVAQYEFTKFVDLGHAALNDLSFMCHIKDNVTKYGITPQIANLLDYDNTTKTMFGVESLNDCTDNPEIALEGLKETISNLIKKVVNFFKMIWDRITHFFTTVKRRWNKIFLNKEKLKDFYKYIDIFKVDVTTEPFKSYLDAKLGDKKKTINMRGAMARIQRVLAVHDGLDKILTREYETAAQLNNDIKSIPTVDLTSDKAEYFFYVKEEGNKFVVHYLSPDKSKDLTRVKLTESGWTTRKILETEGMILDKFNNMVSESETREKLHKFKKHETVMVNDLKKKAQTAEASEGQVHQYVDVVNLSLVVNTTRVQMLLHHINGMIFLAKEINWMVLMIAAIHNQAAQSGKLKRHNYA